MSRVLVIMGYGDANVFIEDEGTKVLIVDYDIHGNPNVVEDLDGDDCVIRGSEVSDPDTKHTVAQFSSTSNKSRRAVMPIKPEAWLLLPGAFGKSTRPT